jgi:hypothetical protein
MKEKYGASDEAVAKLQAYYDDAEMALAKGAA